MADYINVTSLNRLAKRVLEQCDPLNDLIVCGEISGFTRHYKSGHLYFTLKDENASIKTVMFRSQAQLLNFEPQNGMLRPSASARCPPYRGVSALSRARPAQRGRTCRTSLAVAGRW